MKHLILNTTFKGEFDENETNKSIFTAVKHLPDMNAKIECCTSQIEPLPI